jgi:hypothetical protein
MKDHSRLEPLARVSELGATVRCRACTIFIGEGHLERVPLTAPGESGVYCGACVVRILRRDHQARPASAAGRLLGSPIRHR